MGNGAAASSHFLASNWPADGFSWQDFYKGQGTFALERVRGWRQLSNEAFQKDVEKYKDIHKLNLYSRNLGDGGQQCEYCCRGLLNVNPESWLSLLIDLNYRCEWDKSCQTLEELHISGAPKTEHRLVYWEASYPWARKNQDFVLEQCFHSERSTDGSILYCYQNCCLPESEGERVRPSEKDTDRISGYRYHTAVWAAADTGNRMTEFASLMFSQESGLKSSVVSCAITKKMPSEVASMLKAALDYPPVRVPETMKRFSAITEEVLNAEIKLERTADVADV